MFALFYSLYMAMMTGSWTLYNTSSIQSQLVNAINPLGKLLTSIFNNVSTPYETFGTDMTWTYITILICNILAFITSIGIVVVATKGIKKLFTVFFYGVR